MYKSLKNAYILFITQDLKLVASLEHINFQCPDLFDPRYVLQRLLIWTPFDLFPILKRINIAVYIDGTFYSVPKPFFQCAIVMSYED